MNCPLCLQDEVIAVSAVNEIFGKRAGIFQCRRCRSCFVHPVPEASRIDKFYRRTWTDRNRTLGKTTGFVFDLFSRIHQQVKNSSRTPRVDASLRPGMDVLEIGAGDGSFARFLKTKGIHVAVVEPAECFYPELRKKGIEVLGRTLDDLNGRESFDACLAFHVLEHLPDPAKMIRRIRDLLKPRGLFMGEVPNVPFEPDALPETMLQSVFNNAHLFHYSCEGLAALLRRQGLQQIECMEIGFFNRGIRKFWNRANMHYLHPSFQAETMLRVQAAAHALESTFRGALSGSTVVGPRAEPKGFQEPNDFIAFKAVREPAC